MFRSSVFPVRGLPEGDSRVPRLRRYVGRKCFMSPGKQANLTQEGLKKRKRRKRKIKKWDPPNVRDVGSVLIRRRRLPYLLRLSYLDRAKSGT